MKTSIKISDIASLELSNATVADVLANMLSQKVVQFRYNGGSSTGKIRTVRVESVNASHLEGLDLSHQDIRTAYRRYLFTKIDGGIRVLN